MAIRGTLDHPKNLALASQLGIDPCYSLGLLEALWHFTGKYAPTGDITATDPKMLAQSMRFSGDGPRLILTLLETGWLDKYRGRLIVHDWHVWADAAVKKRLEYHGLVFASLRVSAAKTRRKDVDSPESLRVSAASRARVPVPVPVPVPEKTSGVVNTPTVDQERDNGDSPAKDAGAFVLSGGPENGTAPEKPDRGAWFDREFWPVVWARIGKGAARTAFLRVATTAALKDRIVAAAQAQGEAIRARASATGSAVLHPATWLNQGRYDDEETPVPKQARAENASERFWRGVHELSAKEN